MAWVSDSFFTKNPNVKKKKKKKKSVCVCVCVGGGGGGGKLPWVSELFFITKNPSFFRGVGVGGRG